MNKKALKIAFIVLAVLSAMAVWLIGTKSGRRVIYKMAGHYIHYNIQTEDVIHEYNPEEWENNAKENEESKDSVTNGKDEDKDNEADIVPPAPKYNVKPRQEKGITNYLIFGIEEFYGAANTDSMMIATINTVDNTIKLTSLLRDTYMEIPGKKPMKLNAVYARGGAKLLVNTIENNYRIKIDGYAYINFEAFEKIVDRLGGITIELGEKEAHYLNTTNYISDKKLRNVKPGVNNLVGNQVLGYCRIRKVETLGGANDDYGRTLRQRRVLEALFNKYKSQSVFKLIPIMNDCLKFVTTDLTAKQIETMLEDVIENRITTMDTFRIPANGLFETPDEYNGVSSPLVINWEANVKKLYQNIFLDTKEEAEQAWKASMIEVE